MPRTNKCRPLPAAPFSPVIQKSVTQPSDQRHHPHPLGARDRRQHLQKRLGRHPKPQREPPEQTSRTAKNAAPQKNTEFQSVQPRGACRELPSRASPGAPADTLRCCPSSRPGAPSGQPELLGGGTPAWSQAPRQPGRCSGRFCELVAVLSVILGGSRAGGRR